MLVTSNGNRFITKQALAVLFSTLSLKIYPSFNVYSEFIPKPNEIISIMEYATSRRRVAWSNSRFFTGEMDVVTNTYSSMKTVRQTVF